MKTLQTQLLMLLALLFTLSLSAQTTFNVPSTEYPTIQAAIDAAADGDVINIAAGTYDEALNITKGLTLQGEDPTTTILKNSTVNAHTLSVANTADNVTIKNCGFDANGRFITNGINAINFSSGGCDQFMIDNCTFTNGYYCVVNGYVNSLTMQNSTIDNCKSGVNVQKGDNLNITNTTISVIAQGEDNDTYCVRFGNSTPSSTTMNINGCTLTVDKNNFTATEGTYHAAVVIRTGAAGNLSLNQNSLAGEVVNLCTTQLNATCNWWGTTAASTIATLVTGSIDVSTVLDAENGTCVAPTTNLVTNATNNTTYTTIQAAITDADDGDVIEVSIGTFTEILNLQNKQLTINGAGSTQTIIDATGTTTYAIQNFGNNVTISNIKLINSGNYGFKASGCSNLTLTNILAEDNAKTAIDILGVQGATLTNIEVHNTAGGFGLSIGDSEDITVENITTSGNNWAGVTIQSKGAWYPVVCDNIVFTGTFNATDDVELLIEKDPYNEVYSPITNLTLPAQYEYVTYGLRKPGDEDYMQWYYQKTLADAESFAQVIAASTFINVYVANDEEDNFYVAPGLTIQAAVDAATAGDVVNVDAGTYIEQVHITTNDISLIGSSTDDVIIKSPEELSEFYSTSNNNYPVVFIDGVTTTTIKNLTVDGDHQGNSNYRFQGIGIWNSGVVLKDLKVINVMDNPFSGAQHGVGVYSYNNTGGPYTINIDNVDVTDFQKNAFAICGEGVTSSITNCDVVGAGPTDVTAQNGIQVYGKNSVSTITDCTISDIEWTGETWTASAFLSHYADCEISNVDITNGQTNFYTYGSSITLNNSSITNPSGDAFYGWALSPESTKNQIIPEASPYFDESFMGDQKSTSNINVTISNLDITGLDFENSWGIGILADPNSQATASITNCNISHFDYAIVAYDYSSDETGIVNISAHENNLSDNTFGFGSNSTILQNANRNYWGDPTGPYHLDLNPNGLGAEVEDNISFFPYYTDAAMTTLCEMPPVYNSSQETYATTIQGAIDAANDYDVIMVAPGTYTERVVIDKPLSLYGATYDVSKYGYTIPANYQWDDNSESVINYPGNLPEDIFQAVDILSSDVTFKGFIVQILNAKKDFDNNLLRINGTIDRPDDDHMTLDNITIENNILGPVTNTASQDGTYGRMNLYLATPCYPADYQGLTNSTIADNKIIDALGNGNNIFIWGAAEAYNSTQNADYTNTVIEHNDICGSHRSGIEIAGGVDNLIITENHIYDNASINGGTSSTDLKYGNGILLIRMGSDKASPTARGPQNMIISNNIIEDNEKHGLYIGPFNKDLTITGNSFLNNGMSGIITDLTEAYHGGANPQYDVTSNVAAHENIISGNTNFGANVEGTPTNGFQLQAQLNYWGDETGPQHATANSSGAGDEVSDYVVFEPFYDNENLIGNLLLSTVSVPTAAYPNLNAALNAVADEGTILITGNFNQPAVTIDKRVTIIAETGVNPVITPLCSTPGALITVDYNTEVEITNLTFDFSGANENGAVIAMQGTEATISGCTFTGHAATGSGERALVITNGAEVAVQACTFSGFGSGTETATTATEAAIHIHNGGGNAPEVEIIPDNYFDNNYIGIHVGVDPATTDNSEVLINENVFGETICNAYAVKIEHGDAEVTAHENIFHCHTIYMVSAPTGSAPFDFSYNYWEDNCDSKGGTYEGDINDVPQYTDENLNNLDVSVYVAPANSLTTGGATNLTYNVNISNVTCMGGFDVTLTLADADFTNISFTEGTFLNSHGSTIWWTSNAGESYTISCSLEGTSNNASNAGTLFTIALDTKNIENLTGALINITDVTLRGPNNESIECSGFADGIVVIDNTTPAMTALVEAENAYYNTAPTLTTFEFADNRGLNRIEFNYDNDAWQEIINDISGTTWNGTEGNTPAVYTLPDFTNLSEGIHTINWKATDDAGNTSTFAWTFYKDTQIPAGNRAMAISGVTTTGMTITGAAVEDAVEGHEYYIFDCLTDNVYDKLRAENINQYDLTGMGTNTLYQFKYKVTDGVTNNHAATEWEEDANISDWSYTYSRHTLSVAPTLATVTCNRTTETWYKEPTFTFTSVGGFGEGTNVEYYRYVWDRHATHSWNGVEEVWNTNDLTVTSTDGDNWYLHVKGYNGDNIANGTLDLGPFYYDGIAPYPVAVFNGLTDDNNNNSVILTWVDDSQEANFEYYEIFAATFGNYPTYAGGSEKTAPADHASAVSSADWSFIGTTTDLTYTHTPETRDYYYYVVFAKDLAGNYSVVSDRAECLSYWLGDVNATPDGLVNSDDISLLGAAWGGAITTYPNINVGPTVDYARDSRPTPDEAIDFEDLMIFSMNYGNTSYSKGTTLPESVDPVYLSMHREIAEGCLQVSIHLIGNESLVHGLNIKLTLGDGLNVKTVNKGDVWTDMDFFMYTSENQVLEITGATLGTGTSIAGDGSIANLVFEMNGDNTTTEYLEVVARDNENRNIAIILNPITGTGSIDQANALGLTAAPNPFTAYTQIAFNNENRQRVTLAVYNLNGQVITTLCKDMLDKGNHTFYWNGTDFKGSRLPNGIYLIRLTAGTQSAFTKAILTD